MDNGSSGFIERPGADRQWYDLFSRGARDWLRHNDKVRDAVREKLPELIARGRLPARATAPCRSRCVSSSTPVSACAIPTKSKASAKATASPATCCATRSRARRAWQGRRRQRRGRLSVGPGAQDRRHRRLAVGRAQAAEPQGQERRAARRGLRARRLGPPRRAIAARSAPLGEGSRQAPRGQARRVRRSRTTICAIASSRCAQRPATQAVVFFVMDVSSSMTERDRQLAKTFFFWVVQGLRRQYTHHRAVFVAHTVKAWEFAEAEFFQVSGSGGTVASAAFARCSRSSTSATIPLATTSICSTPRTARTSSTIARPPQRR